MDSDSLLDRPYSAIVAYEQYTRGALADVGTWDPLPFHAAAPLAPAYRRLGELYEAKNDRVDALRAYGKFVDLWKNADADLQP